MATKKDGCFMLWILQDTRPLHILEAVLLKLCKEGWWLFWMDCLSHTKLLSLHQACLIHIAVFDEQVRICSVPPWMILQFCPAIWLRHYNIKWYLRNSMQIWRNCRKTLHKIRRCDWQWDNYPPESKGLFWFML